MALQIVTQPATGKIVYARSPILYKFSGCDLNTYTYTISIYVTTGTTSDLIEYKIIKRIPDLNNYIVFDVGLIIKNYIRLNFQFDLNNAVYIQCVLKEYLQGSLNNTITSNIAVAIYGYSEYNDGFNYNKTTADLHNNSNIIYLPNYSTYNDFMLNFINKGGQYYISYTSNTGSTVTVGSGVPSISNATDNIYSIECGYNKMLETYDNLDINKPFRFTYYVNSAETYVYNFYPETCNGNDLHELKYVNKYGVWDYIFIRGKVDKKTDVKSETYKFNFVDYSNMTYPKMGSSHKLFTNGQTTYQLNTGWINENDNEKIEELLYSEYVFFDDIPVIITDKSMTYKTHRFDKLINYQLQVQEAFDKINNIY